LALRLRGSEKERDELWEFSLLTTIGVVLVFLVIMLVALQSSIRNPDVRWILFIGLLTIGGLVLIARVFPKGNRGFDYEYQEVEVTGNVGKIETEVTKYERALEGNPHSQMIVLKELREVAVRRVMLNRHFSRVEAESLAGNVQRLKKEMSDPDIVWLLASDFDYEYGVDNLSSRMGQEMVANFKRNYISLLKKVEDLR
jgi:hypothetical protein